MTAKQIHKEVSKYKKVTLRQVRNYIHICGIKRIGMRQRPENYPNNAAEIIVHELGYTNGGGN